MGRAPGGTSGTGRQPTGCPRRRASGRPRGWRGLPAPPCASDTGQAHPGLGSANRASNRGRRRRPGRRRRLHRTRCEWCTAHSCRCLTALSGRADRRRPRQRTHSHSGRGAALNDPGRGKDEVNTSCAEFSPLRTLWPCGRLLGSVATSAVCTWPRLRRQRGARNERIDLEPNHAVRDDGRNVWRHCGGRSVTGRGHRKR